MRYNLLAIKGLVSMKIQLVATEQVVFPTSKQSQAIVSSYHHSYILNACQIVVDGYSVGTDSFSS